MYNAIILIYNYINLLFIRLPTYFTVTFNFDIHSNKLFIYL